MSKYGFNGRLSEEFPSQVMVDITEVCNLGCIHCTHPKFKLSSVYNKRMLKPEINKKMVDEVARDGKGKTKYIRYTSNGEPLVHPKSYEMLQYAVENSGTKVTLTTNGTLLNEKKMKKLLSTGLHMIDISIDAFSNEIYKIVRVGGDLEVTRKNVLRLLELNDEVGHNTKIIVSFVEQKENSHEIEKFKEFWSRQSVDDVLIRKLHTNSGSVPNEKSVKVNQISDEKNNRRPCLYPWERAVLTAKGSLNFCPTDWFGKSEVGDFSKMTIKDIWKNTFYKDLRNQHLNNNYKNEFCKQCPDWKNTSWPFDEKKSYADLVEKILYEEK
jgi:radical SAM protein with 4Fe4S-binding SPASM domain